MLKVAEARNIVCEFLQKTRSKSQRATQTLTVSLYQIGFGSDSEPIQTFEIDPGESDLSSLATDIVDYAEKEAEGVGPGYDRINFTVMVDGERGQKTFSLFFPEEEEEGEEDEFEMRDPFGGPAPKASVQSAMSMLMQHTQVSTQMMVRQSAESYRMLQRELIEVRRENAELRRERIKFYGLWENMMSEQHKRDLETRETEHGMQLKTAAFGKIASLGIPLLNHITGKKLVAGAPGQADSVVEATVIEFASSLTAEQQQAIATSGILNEEQLLTIMSLVNAVKSKQQEAVSSPVVTPYQPANGVS